MLNIIMRIKSRNNLSVIFSQKENFAQRRKEEDAKDAKKTHFSNDKIQPLIRINIEPSSLCLGVFCLAYCGRKYRNGSINRFHLSRLVDNNAPVNGNYDFELFTTLAGGTNKRVKTNSTLFLWSKYENQSLESYFYCVLFLLGHLLLIKQIQRCLCRHANSRYGTARR